MPLMPPSEPSSQQNLASLLPLLLGGQQGGGGGGGMGGGGGSDFVPGGGGPAALARRIGGWIESRPGTDFQVSGLEGFQGTGQVSSGHIDNSQHYTGHAGDVNYYGGQRFPNEMVAMDWLENRLQNRWGDALTELIWREPDHYDHLHYGTRPGG
jgi:hypothetical protein